MSQKHCGRSPFRRTQTNRHPLVEISLHWTVKDYSFLVNGEAAADIEKFMAEEHSFEDYCAFIEKFRTVTREINDLDNVVHFDMVRIRLRQLCQITELSMPNQPISMIQSVPTQYTLQ